MGRIMLATSASTDEEYGGNINETSQNITLTSSKSSDFEGQHFVKNGIAYIAGFFTPSQNITGTATVGTLNFSCDSNSAQWIGRDTVSNALVGGYIYQDQLVSTQNLTASHAISIFAQFNIATS